jgi:predicted NBD/HSP70 family sugar kinase
VPGSKVPLRAADLRERNEKIVLRLIRDAGPCGLAQSEAAATTGLTAPTAFRIFQSLEEAGYIEPAPSSCAEAAAGKERKGRPKVSWVARSAAIHALGVEFWADRVSLGVFDFRGERLVERAFPLPRGIDARGVVSEIAGAACGALGELGIARERILGLGLGAPGQVNVRTREIAFYSRIPGMRDFPMAGLLEEELGIPVSIHNNCAVIALSELRYGAIKDANSLFMFLLRSGVNGAFVDGGRIALASDGTTIETGHIAIAYDGETCVCGAKGCLEAYITSLDRDNIEAGKRLFEDLGPAVERGDAGACGILRVAARFLAAASRTVSRLFRPQTFLVVAASEPVAAALARFTEEALARDPSGFDQPPSRFEARAYDARLVERGAADLVIDAFLG